MDIFFLQLIVIFIPGIIWERVDAQYGRARATQQWDILRRTFTFGLASYLITYLAYWVAEPYYPGLKFYFFDFKKDASFLDAAAAKQIFVTSGVALLCSVIWLYQANYKALTRILQRLNATKRYGDEDVWDFMFNSGRPEVEYIHLRDFDKKLVYCGWVESWSESEKQRELVLRDVIVYDIEGELLFETARVYLARKADNIDIEFPHRVGTGKTNDESREQQQSATSADSPAADGGLRGEGGTQSQHVADTDKASSSGTNPAA